MARVRREWIDQVTGAPVPGPRAGAIESGRYVARMRATKGAPLVTVEVDPDDVRTADASFAIDREAVPSLRDQAAKVAKAAKRKPARKTKRQRLPGVAETYRSAGKAASIFAAGEGNAALVDDVSEHGDPHDVVRDWMDGIEVKRGRGFRRLTKTKKGAALLALFGAGPDRNVRAGILGVLRWLFSQNRGKRWDAAPWDMVRGFGEALAADCETNVRPAVAPDEPASGCAGFQWFPLASGEVDPAAVLEELPEAAAAQVSAEENQERLRLEVDALAQAYKEGRACMPKETQAAVRRRLRFLRKLAKEPERIEHLYLCAPEGWGRLCGFHAVAADIERVRGACVEPYRADWPEVEARQGRTTPGLPDAVERLRGKAPAEPEHEAPLITEEELAAMPHPAEQNPPKVAYAQRVLARNVSGLDKPPAHLPAILDIEGGSARQFRSALVRLVRDGFATWEDKGKSSARMTLAGFYAGQLLARQLAQEEPGGQRRMFDNPTTLRKAWEGILEEHRMLKRYCADMARRTAKEGQTKKAAEWRRGVKRQQKRIAEIETLLAGKNPERAGPWGELTDPRGRETHVLSVRVRTPEQGEREHVWHDNHPRLKWSEAKRALVWVHGGRESAKVLAQKQNPAGRATSIVYRQAKGGGAAGTTDYKHDFGPGVRFGRGSGRTPSLFSVRGGKLKSTGRGLVG